MLSWPLHVLVYIERHFVITYIPPQSGIAPRQVTYHIHIYIVYIVHHPVVNISERKEGRQGKEWKGGKVL
jgi:hypothetical protein